jgi:hypothetical protein
MQPFQLKRLSDYSDEALIAEMQRVAAIVPGEVLTRREFEKHSRVSSSTIGNHFGSWREGLQVAGLAHRYNVDNTNRRNKKRPAKNASDRQLLDEVLLVARQLGTSSITREEFEAHSEFSAYAISQRFGSWRAALKRIGLQPGPLGRRYTDEECFENLLSVWTHYGRQPRHDEMKTPPSTVGPKAYVLRWGTWMKALEAFVNKMNQTDGGDDDAGAASTNGAPQSRPLNPAEGPNRFFSDGEKRDIKLGLRWKVFRRDRFRCVKCGASPATDPTCEQLHADHIIPFSKGGKTVLQNLQTLCQRCNLGKGNRSEGEEEA